MSLSVFDMFSIGVGPSSSHTVGPMRAAKRFADLLENKQLLEKTVSMTVDLYGSLALTGKGHGTDTAVLLGLCGNLPEDVDPEQVPKILDAIRQQQQLKLLGKHEIAFCEKDQLVFHYDEFLDRHANGMRFTAQDKQGKTLLTRQYYSVGGGFVMDDDDFERDTMDQHEVKVKFPFHNAETLLAHCHKQGKDIAGIMLDNELAWRSKAEIKTGLLAIWQVMDHCIEAGCRHPGILPGGLKVRRRAADLFAKLQKASNVAKTDMNWLNLYALAVNEENAAGGRVVTAPTNGAAGIIPAVLKYYVTTATDVSDDKIVDFMLTAGALGILYKLGASISAAEVGCQGEVGVACSMAAGALCAVWGGTVEQVENAAEIGMEHNLGLTCDPIGGLVQVPCIERNTMGAVQAVNAAKLALMGDGSHLVSLDKVIETMRDTGKDMMMEYKETSQGGLAKQLNVTKNLPEC